MLALEHSAKEWPFNGGGGGRPTAPTSIGYGPVNSTEIGYNYRRHVVKLLEQTVFVLQ